jgi:hypothetical protein
MLGPDLADAAFDQQLDVRRAALVVGKAVPERVLQVRDLEVIGAPLVVTVQERAVGV